MSDRSGRTTVEVAILLAAALIVFAGLVEGVASWVQAVSAPTVEGANAVNTDPSMTWENRPKISEAKAREIAIKEVKQREGWLGKADQPSREGSLWFFAVRRKPGAIRDWRYITISGSSGKIFSYEVRTDPHFGDDR